MCMSLVSSSQDSLNDNDLFSGIKYYTLTEGDGSNPSMVSYEAIIMEISGLGTSVSVVRNANDVSGLTTIAVNGFGIKTGNTITVTDLQTTEFPFNL